MERMRWRTARRRGLRIGTRRWWIGFAGGALVILIVKGLLVSNNTPIQNGKQHESMESAPIIQLEPSDGKRPVDDSSISQSGDTPDSQNADAPKGGEGPGRQDAASSVPDRQASGQQPQANEAEPVLAQSWYDRLRVRVYLTDEKKIETMPIELYVRGVLAGEMPLDFELEALKAQAIAARTYIYRRMSSGDRSGLKAVKADVNNTVQHQVYIPLEKLLTRWKGEAKEDNLAILNRAVEETKGQIITYNGEPIQAAFFSTSNGYTENAADYWEIDLPYLHSVASPWDKEISPRYKETVTMKLSTFAGKLNVKKSAVPSMRVLEKTEGRRIKTVAVGNKTFTGREIREKLGLASSQFSWKIGDGEIAITTYGFGHGVGMSQWGANGMAQSGKSAKQIVEYYYSGAKVEQASKLPMRS
ncbi:stage II sporulation protein D [Paenibacillus spongiae]|uniref:Stage II sporulation protein D n=1 Tax=Paenibacillus spongiae TaxID=2909671 RepID=A0ABY5S7N4_9BACL|nr:stage II sporulation protein D [Paenibacillus spongiae]UVI29931.1 stage II sporulation protein D [Paenibacillus spongiae]